MPEPLRVGLVGLGKIARDRHIPALSDTACVRLVAVADPVCKFPDVPGFSNLAEMLQGAALDAVALCTPPQVRGALARTALRAGKHVLLEKPPGATLNEAALLADLARAEGRTLFSTWHSRYAPGVAPARDFLAGRRIDAVRIVWKEDVRVWHPGQDWIWQPGGFGVFDPGINALSIVTHILPRPVFVTGADLYFPEGRDAPIAARLALTDAEGTPVHAEFDWRQQGEQTWSIEVDTDAGCLAMTGGGRRLALDGTVMADAAKAEYEAIYRRFATLAATGQSDADFTPLALVADAFMLARRHVVAPFAFSE